VALFAERLPGRNPEDAEAKGTLGRSQDDEFGESQLGEALDGAFKTARQ
jgi:hypothetical protein